MPPRLTAQLNDYRGLDFNGISFEQARRFADPKDLLRVGFKLSVCDLRDVCAFQGEPLLELESELLDTLKHARAAGTKAWEFKGCCISLQSMLVAGYRYQDFIGLQVVTIAKTSALPTRVGIISALPTSAHAYDYEGYPYLMRLESVEWEDHDRGVAIARLRDEMEELTCRLGIDDLHKHCNNVLNGHDNFDASDPADEENWFYATDLRMTQSSELA